MMHSTLDRFEEIILRHLHNLCGKELAERIMNVYLPVIRELQDDHDAAKVQAERIYKAHKDGIRPEAWIEHIRKTRQKYSSKLASPTMPAAKAAITVTVVNGASPAIRSNPPATLVNLARQKAAKQRKQAAKQPLRRDSATGRFLPRESSSVGDAGPAEPIRGSRKVKPVQ
ncbi:hypothetical protein B5M42_006025 [Paenibacillus athensensis]|uniref:Uncharacterized protein n=1 Tax=Paenibacillus athensensis TaxID=1967502 RepID=A0A4Y8Q5Z5_9BACL|nr:hypothetical protein [Paenibacillus athensensis]MCD1258398.1 hypothetical protein [Paenibacillus athensensis]